MSENQKFVCGELGGIWSFISPTPFTQNEFTRDIGLSFLQVSVAKIFLDNSTSIEHSGTCYNATASANSTGETFVLFNLMLDDCTTNFTFTFNISGDTYDLVDIHLEYDPISQYFPNHENISGKWYDK